MTESVVIEPLSAEEADAFAVLVAERNRWESIWSEPPQVMAFWLLDVAKLCHLSPDDAARIVRGLVAKDKMFFEAPVSGLAEQVDPDEPPRFPSPNLPAVQRS